MRYREILNERAALLPIALYGSNSKDIPVCFHPTRSEIIGFTNRHAVGVDAQLRGLILRDDWLVWAAQDAIHNSVERALGREGEWDDTDQPYEHYFYVEVKRDGQIIYIGNPDLPYRYMPRFTKTFDLIDLLTGQWTEYEPSEWGLPARETARNLT